MAFTVTIDQFEGPLDLMLHLIKEKELDLLETPNTSVGYLLENLTDEEKRKENQLFAELYSWYLNSPDYCTMTKN